MRAYKIENWCNLGPRVIVHPRGLPPGWSENNLPLEVEAEARKRGLSNRVVHLNPETFEEVERFRLI